MRIGYQHAHAHGETQFALIAPDLAVADHAQRGAAQLAAHGCSRHVAGVVDRAGGADSAAEIDHGTDDPLRHRGNEARARLGYEDTHLARHRNVDIADIDGAARDRKSTRLNPVTPISRMPSSA